MGDRSPSPPPFPSGTSGETSSNVSQPATRLIVPDDELVRNRRVSIAGPMTSTPVRPPVLTPFYERKTGRAASTKSITAKSRIAAQFTELDVPLEVTQSAVPRLQWSTAPKRGGLARLLGRHASESTSGWITDEDGGDVDPTLPTMTVRLPRFEGAWRRYTWKAIQKLLLVAYSVFMLIGCAILNDRGPVVYPLWPFLWGVLIYLLLHIATWIFITGVLKTSDVSYHWKDKRRTRSVKPAANFHRRRSDRPSLLSTTRRSEMLGAMRHSLESSPVMDPASPGGDISTVLRAISHPEVEFLRPNYRRPSRRRVSSKEDRERRTGRLFGEGDWQGLLDETDRQDTTSWGSKFMHAARIASMEGLLVCRQLVGSPEGVLSTILRNVIWCCIFLWQVASLHRTSLVEPWSFERMSYYASFLDETFRWQMTFDHILLLVCAPEARTFFTDWTTLVDLITLPALTAFVQQCGWRVQPIYLGALRFFRLFRLESLISVILPGAEPVSLVLFSLLMDTVVVFMTFTSAMYLLEGPQDSRDFRNVFDFVYYSVVTMTTVGYGDYAAQTRGGRWLTVCAILGGFVVFPYHVQRLINVIHTPAVMVGHMPSRHEDYLFIYGRISPRQLAIVLSQITTSLPRAIRHVCVVTPFAASSFKTVVTDLLRDFKLRVCVSQKCPTSEELQLLCQHARATYIVADPRAGGKDNQTGSYGQLLTEDQKTFLKLSKAQAWSWPKVPICVQLAHGMYSALAYELGAYHVVSLELLKLACIGRAVAGCPGFINLVFNWYIQPLESSSVNPIFKQMHRRRRAVLKFIEKKRADPHNPKLNTLNQEEANIDAAVDEEGSDEDMGGVGVGQVARFLSGGFKKYSRERFNMTEKDAWDELNFYQYFHGLKYHVYRLQFPECFTGLDFTLLVRLLYRRFQVFLIGLVDMDKRYFMNPAGFIIGDEHEDRGPLDGVVLSPGFAKVEAITSLKKFYVAPNAVAVEKRLLGRKERTKTAFVGASEKFLNNLRQARTALEEEFTSQINTAQSQPPPDSSVGPRHYFSSSHLLDRPGFRRQHGPVTPSAGVSSRWIETPAAKPKVDSPKIEMEDVAVIKETYSAVSYFKDLALRPLVLCCGWPQDLYHFLNIIEINGPRNVLILASHDAPDWGRWNRELKPYTNSCAWLHGSPLSLEDLKNAGALLAETIVLLADHHAFKIEGENTDAGTTIDNQTILVRQQVFALFARIDEYLKTLRHEQQGSGSSSSLLQLPRRNAIEEEDHGLEIEMTLPTIITELQERQNVEHLSAPRDIFLLRALGVNNQESYTHQLIRKKGEGGDDSAWAAEGGRKTTTEADNLEFQLQRSSLDFATYAIQSEFRSGRLFVREMGYSLFMQNLPASSAAIDTSFIDHLADGNHSYTSGWLARHDCRSPLLSPYKWKSPLQLIPIMPMFAGLTFRDAFVCLLKMELMLVVAVLRVVDSETSGATANSPLELLRGQGAGELVINCPNPSMPLLSTDRLYVFMPTSAHELGILLSESGT